MKEEVLQIKTMGEKISTLFINAYEKHLLLVNRKYQRRLLIFSKRNYLLCTQHKMKTLEKILKI